MHKLEKIILEQCRHHHLFRDGEKVIIAVSGGSDSVALLHVLYALSGELGIQLVIAHVNHGLRPEESDREAQLVRKYASDLGLAFHCKSFDVKAIARQEGLSIEELARNVRYAYFKEILAAENATKICIAHHADDQAEEVLLRLIRGAGRKGLSGMDLIRDEQIVRPFLYVSKAEILEFLQDRSIDYLDDSSNSSLDFLRNRIRLELLPYLENFNPNIRKTLRRAAAVFTDEEEVFEEISAAAYERTVSKISAQRSGEAGLAVNLGKFTELQIAIKRRVAEKALIAMQQKPSFAYIQGILELTGKKNGSVLHLSRGLRVSRQPTQLEFIYPKGITSERGDLQEELKPFEIKVDCPGIYVISSLGKEIVIEVVDEIPVLDELKNSSDDYFDHDRLRFPFVIRNRWPGDIMTPYGSSGTKKVGRLLSDLKIAPENRDAIPLVVYDDKVAGVLGVRVSQQFCVRENTKRVLIIKF